MKTNLPDKPKLPAAGLDARNWRIGAEEELARVNRRPMIAGMAVVFGFVGSFLLWGAFAPLAGGAVAKGVVSPDGSRRTVQHLEGGIISKLLVQDGDQVTKGQELLILENVQPRSRREVLRAQYVMLSATRIRLEAEKDGREKLEFPPALIDASAGAAEQVLDAQRKLFMTRRTMLNAQKDVLNQRIQQLEKQISGLDAQLASMSRQREIIADELQDKSGLMEKGLMRKPEFQLLDRQREDLTGRSGETAAQIAKARMQIGETQMQLVALDAERANQVATDLAKVDADLVTTEEQLLASEDVLSRTAVTSPVNGTVLNLKFKTVGGVIKPGETIVEIVPSEERLVIDARVAPTDIDVVHKGLKAQIHLTAFSTRLTPRLVGELISVAADRSLDERTGQPFYLARIEVDREELEKLRPELQLVPGMPADVLIVTEYRTMLEYLAKPLYEVLRKSLREA